MFSQSKETIPTYFPGARKYDMAKHLSPDMINRSVSKVKDLNADNVWYQKVP